MTVFLQDVSGQCRAEMLSAAGRIDPLLPMEGPDHRSINIGATSNAGRERRMSFADCLPDAVCFECVAPSDEHLDATRFCSPLAQTGIRAIGIPPHRHAL